MSTGLAATCFASVTHLCFPLQLPFFQKTKVSRAVEDDVVKQLDANDFPRCDVLLKGELRRFLWHFSLQLRPALKLL